MVNALESGEIFAKYFLNVILIILGIYLGNKFYKKFKKSE